ncbi:MAG TPA: hypothetical protein PLU72_09080 [Candidatus Ozemobacteraceae bacterium]|nr:hypothetical protein [Candidatus Ozemobacteraceae bacterium]
MTYRSMVRCPHWFVLLLLVLLPVCIAVGATNFYKENRNGKVFILQVDPSTNIETVFNPDKSVIFLAPKAKRVAVLPTAGWGERTSNKTPLGDPLGVGEYPGDPNAIITLRVKSLGGATRYELYRGASRLLWAVDDYFTAYNPDNNKFDIAVSQYMGRNKDEMRVYVYISNLFYYFGPVIIKLEFKNNALVEAGYKITNDWSWYGIIFDSWFSAYSSPSPQRNRWQNVTESGDRGSAQSISVNATSDTSDLLVYHPTRSYSLQHVWDTSRTNGSWGINYLLDNNRVKKAKSTNYLTNDPNQMTQIFDVGMDLGNAYADTLLYYRSYYNHGNTFVANNVNTNTSLSHLYYDVEDAAGQMVEIRDGAPNGAVLNTIRVNPNPLVLGHNAVGLYGLSCRNALSGSELIVYEPVYKINQNAVDMLEITDNNRNNVPDHVDNDGKGYFGYRADYLIDRNNGSAINSDYVLDYVIAHRFPLSGKTANDEFTYQEMAIERDPSASPSRMIPGEIVHVRVGNIWHQDPDVYGEYNQFGWDGGAGNSVFIWVGNPGEPYRGFNGSTTPVRRNSGHILGVEVKNTSYATADYFGVVGNDEWAAGQGDLYFLSRKYGAYVSPRIVASNNPWVPPVSGYNLWWKYQYNRSTSYGISRTYWIGSNPTSEWLNTAGFFIGNSVYSQMVYNINCGCRGQRYDNFQLVSEASSPILDFAIVNIGAPPFVDGTIAPTIVANNGGVVVQPNTPVYFTGGYSDPAGLIDPATVKFRYVILDDAFNDTDPSADPKLVIDSSVVNGGNLLTTPNWNYVFKDTDLRGRRVATFTVYLGIQFKCQDFTQMPYPSYSWWGTPIVEKFAWSNSRGGMYYDGTRHDKWGAPLRITVDTQRDPTPEHPVVVTNVQAYSDLTSGWTSGAPKADQGRRIKLRVIGDMLFLSEIPAPQTTNFSQMGGVMPWPFGVAQTDNHYRVSMYGSGMQYDVSRGTVLSNAEFKQDLAGIKYGIYIRSSILNPDGTTSPYTQTVPLANSDHMLYEGATPPHQGFTEIASGTLDGIGTTRRGLFDPGACSVVVTPDFTNRLPNQRKFKFTIETPWMYLPVPLDGGMDDTDVRDKYEVRVALKYPVAQWSQVTVKNYNTNILTNSYNCSKVEDQHERSYSTNFNQRVYLRIMDKEGPAVTEFVPPAQGASGDPSPSSAIRVRLVDNNPHDYWKRGRHPQVRYVLEAGADPSLNIANEGGLDIDYTGWNTAGPYTLPSGLAMTSQGGRSWAYKTAAVDLSSWSMQLSTFPGLVQLRNDPVGNLINANTLYSPCFNQNQFVQHWALYDDPAGAPNFDGDGLPIATIRDGSGNPQSAGVATGTTVIADNEPPNIRLIVSDDMNLDVMIEVKGGYRDTATRLVARSVKVSNLKQAGSTLFEATVATTTPTFPVASLTEIYDLGTFAGRPAGYSISVPVQAGAIPLSVCPDSRLRVVGEGFDNANAGKTAVSISIPHPDTPVAGAGSVESIFRRGLSGNTYVITAETVDGAGHKVKILVPFTVSQPGMIDVRTIEESSRKK